MSYLCYLCLFVYSDVFFVLFVFVLCLVYPMLPVSLNCSFLLPPSVFSNVYSTLSAKIKFICICGSEKFIMACCST